MLPSIGSLPVLTCQDVGQAVLVERALAIPPVALTRGIGRPSAINEEALIEDRKALRPIPKLAHPAWQNDTYSRSRADS